MTCDSLINLASLYRSVSRDKINSLIHLYFVFYRSSLDDIKLHWMWRGGLSFWWSNRLREANHSFIRSKWCIGFGLSSWCRKLHCPMFSWPKAYWNIKHKCQRSSREQSFLKYAKYYSYLTVSLPRCKNIFLRISNLELVSKKLVFSPSPHAALSMAGTALTVPNILRVNGLW